MNYKNKKGKQTFMKKEKLKITKTSLFMILAIILIAIFCISVSPVTMQNDTYYTIKIGEHIHKYGIDMKDPFSWHEDLGYTYPHWLYDLLTYYIYSATGFMGIFIVTCILSCILGISLFLVTEKLTKNKVISFIVTIGAMYVLKPYIAARAQLVTFILFIWTIYFIEKFIETGKIKYAIPLILIPIAIANLHVAVWPFYFVLYLPYIGEYILAYISEIVFYDKIQRHYMKKKIEYLQKIKNKGQKNVDEKIEKAQAQLKEMNEKAMEILKKLTSEENIPEKYYHAVFDAEVAGIPCIVSKTGYTGEDGVELYLASEKAEEMWDTLLEAGKEEGLVPCGLGARDTLRMEAAMPLYGHEMNDDITPLETGLKFAVKMAKNDFIGKSALEEKGTPSIKRIGLKVTGRGIIREHQDVYAGDRKIGHTTSGTHCPYLGYPIAMALVDADSVEIGDAVEADVRGRRVAAEVVALPFYKREK